MGLSRNPCLHNWETASGQYMQPFSLSPSSIMIDESLEIMAEGKVTGDAKKIWLPEKNLTFRIKSICHVVMLLFVLMKSFQAPLTAYPLNLEDVMMSCAHEKDMLSHSIQNKEYHLSVFHLCFRESHRLKIVQLYSLKMSVSGNYGSAIKMMGKDKRQLIWNISHVEYFFRYYERYLCMRSSKKVYKKAKLS